MSVQAQWNLDYSVGSVLSVALGVFRAASRNNVQPLAILACEGFGNTIAMCQETCRKVEQAMKTPDSTMINFIQISVGFSIDDCGSQLSQSLAGVQFLGLAIALVGSLSLFESGTCLELLLRSSSSDKTLLPTARQLKDLLAGIESRCYACGFSDSHTGWMIFLAGHTRMSPSQRNYWRGAMHYPDNLGIERLVDGLRQLARIGDTRPVHIQITSSYCTPWVIAFTKWCLGYPPSVFLVDGTPILESPTSAVTVYAIPDDSRGGIFEISIFGSVQNPTDLLVFSVVNVPSAHPTSIETYGKMILKVHCDMWDHSSVSYRAFCQAIQYSIRLILQNLKFDHQGGTASSANGVTMGPYNCQLSNMGLIPFPKDQIIMEMAARILGLATPPSLLTLDEGILISDLPVVKLHLETVSNACKCSKCSKWTSVEGELNFSTCGKERFFDNLAATLTEILSLSLFEHPETLLVCPSLHDFDSKFCNAVRTIVTTNRTEFINIFSVLESALMSVGHYDPNTGQTLEIDSWMMSSMKGQAIYLKIYEAYQVERQGFLTLSWIPGLIRYNGQEYNIVLGNTPETPTSEPNEWFNIPVSSPCNLFSRSKVIWQVSEQDLHLVVGLAVQTESGNIFGFTQVPYILLNNLASASYLEACPHDPNSNLIEADRFCVYVSPSLRMESLRSDLLSVVPVHGDSRMRFLTLSGGGQLRNMVLRKNACLACCLSFCRRIGANYLVL